MTSSTVSFPPTSLPAAAGVQGNLPALPAIAAELHASSGAVQATGLERVATAASGA